MLRLAVILSGVWCGLAVAAEGVENRSEWLSNCGDEDFRTFDTPPVMVDSTAVEYPDMAVRSELGGQVLVEIAIMADGEPCGMHINQGVHPLLDREAIKAAWASTYRSALRDGMPTAGLVEVSYHFDFEAVRRLRAARIRPDLTDLSPLLSEIPEATAVNTPEAFSGSYLFDGVEVRGDISQQHVQTVMRLARERAERQGKVEEITLIIILKDVVPSDPDHRGIASADWRADLLVETCRRRLRDGSCAAGSTYSFRYDGGQFEFVHGGGWIVCVEDPPLAED